MSQSQSAVPARNIPDSLKSLAPRPALIASPNNPPTFQPGYILINSLCVPPNS